MVLCQDDGVFISSSLNNCLVHFYFGLEKLILWSIEIISIHKQNCDFLNKL